MLTERQREVAQLVALGWSNKRIARELDISARTVEAHIFAAASTVGLPCRPRHALTLFVLSTGDHGDA